MWYCCYQYTIYMVCAPVLKAKNEKSQEIYML